MKLVKDPLPEKLYSFVCSNEECRAEYIARKSELRTQVDNTWFGFCM